jgi:hypothetical protein
MKRQHTISKILSETTLGTADKSTLQTFMQLNVFQLFIRLFPKNGDFFSANIKRMDQKNKRLCIKFVFDMNIFIVLVGKFR